MSTEDDYSSSSSSSLSDLQSSPSSVDLHSTRSPSNCSDSPPPPPPPASHKRKAGRKKFRETRHPVYRGVRCRKGGKWVCELREPHKKSRIWLGTFPNPEMAAKAHDVAALALRGELAALNFPESASLLPRPKSASTKDIQFAALEAAEAFRSAPNDQLKAMGTRKVRKSSAIDVSGGMRHVGVLDTSLGSLTSVGRRKNLQPESSSVPAPDGCSALFVDEEALFNMPGLINSMAEGLLITPPAMKEGFNWDDVAGDMDMTLWKD